MKKIILKLLGYKECDFCGMVYNKQKAYKTYSIYISEYGYIDVKSNSVCGDCYPKRPIGIYSDKTVINMDFKGLYTEVLR